MRILLIPGFWLSGDSWSAVTLFLADHGIHPDVAELPGRGPKHENRASVGIMDQIASVVAWLDQSPEPAILVGHSAGGNIAYGAADQRPLLVEHLILIDTVPPRHGGIVNDSLPTTNGVIDFPGVDFFAADETRGLVGDVATTVMKAVNAESARCATEPITLSDPRRLSIPATIIACTFTADNYWAWTEHDDEVIEDVSVIELPTGHWPQFSRPRELARCLADSILTSS